ncbi:hypothetical protein [Burkholderia oklahomensis]|nr:hypothetical protein [Burkholderia oklahomensis]MBI0361154.1 hypothetical protein [Burkholderia oklahomensis]QPS37515.1 hypothetical protein I6G57_01075 [Burkholderia oklahomensis]
MPTAIGINHPDAEIFESPDARPLQGNSSLGLMGGAPAEKSGQLSPASRN